MSFVLLSIAAGTPYGVARSYLRARPSDAQMGLGVRSTFEGFALHRSPYHQEARS